LTVTTCFSPTYPTSLYPLYSFSFRLHPMHGHVQR
jgi:hypothetical protein